MTETRRRIDILLDPEFGVGIAERDLETLREQRRMADEVETELSYYRRLLHGRMDLLAFEQRRRAGEEERTLIDALPEILGAGEQAVGDGRGRYPTTFQPEIPSVGKRAIDRVLQDGFLTNISGLSDGELGQIQSDLAKAEAEVSQHRRDVQAVMDELQAELTSRYQSQAASDKSTD